MTSGFYRVGHRIRLHLDATHAQATGVAIAEVAGLVQARHGTDDEPAPTDPVLARLFPDGYRDDPAAATELRGLTQGSLREEKLSHAGTVLDSLPLEGGLVELDADGARAWLLALNDARLALGTRLELTGETDVLDELDDAVLKDPTSTRVWELTVYHFLTILQGTLIDCLDTAE